MSKGPLHLLQAIEERKRKGLFRSLTFQFPGIDLCSNDYLGFSRDGLLQEELGNADPGRNTGSTGSRLISGNSALAETLENDIARFHNAEAALIFNSGYDANVGLLSSVPQKSDLVLYDELIHASLHDGMRLSHAKHYKFRHNDPAHLEELIARHKSAYDAVYVVVESVYSMDGDEAPLLRLTELCDRYGCYLIVDEAHAIGVFGKEGRGLCNELGVEDQCFARVYTYGKAMGCHGAAVAGSRELRDYLINFSRSFIYTTALPPHSLACIKAAYGLLTVTDRIAALKRNIALFNELVKNKEFIPSRSAIHCLLVSGNEEADLLEKKLAENGIYAKSIKSPTVKEGAERIRFCLHAFNTADELKQLSELIA